MPLSQSKSKVLIDGTDKLKQGLLRQLEALGIDECETARNVGADLHSLSEGAWQGRQEERNVPSCSGRQGHTLEISPSVARMLG